ncbi:MAG: hypothetical protein GY826_12610 [Fuerstiella sp.]|nr:hypothetical protein [Fuerstiella sp.]
MTLRQRSIWTDFETLMKGESDMDPQAALFDLLDAIDRNDRDAVNEQLDALKLWNLRGGFLPTVRRLKSVMQAFVVERRLVMTGKKESVEA